LKCALKLVLKNILIYIGWVKYAFPIPIPVVLIGHNCLSFYLTIHCPSQLLHPPFELVNLKIQTATSFNPVLCNYPRDCHLSNKRCENLQNQTYGA